MKELLQRLCAAKGVSGREDGVCALIGGIMKEYADSVTIDKNNNVIAVIGDTSAHNIMLDAHIDQIGFVITYITEGGFLNAAPCGGMDMRVMNDSRFKVMTDSGEITAVVCCLPPHLSDGGEDKAPDADAIYLDTGLPPERVRELVHIGDTATFDVNPALLLNDRFTCCATDNRACCALLVRVAQLIKESPVNSGVTFAFTSQEETYGKGSITAAYSIDPDEAVAVDVSFALQSGVSAHQSGKLGKGCMIGISPVLSRRMSYALIDKAKQLGIPYQFEVTGSLTGTNGDKISISRGGVPTALVSIPQRNMHTGAEIIDLNDIESTARLIYEYIRSA